MDLHGQFVLGNFWSGSWTQDLTAMVDGNNLLKILKKGMTCFCSSLKTRIIRTAFKNPSATADMRHFLQFAGRAYVFSTLEQFLASFSAPLEIRTFTKAVLTCLKITVHWGSSFSNR